MRRLVERRGHIAYDICRLLLTFSVILTHTTSFSWRASGRVLGVRTIVTVSSTGHLLDVHAGGPEVRSEDRSKQSRRNGRSGFGFGRQLAPSGAAFSDRLPGRPQFCRSEARCGQRRANIAERSRATLPRISPKLEQICTLGGHRARVRRMLAEFGRFGAHAPRSEHRERL